MKISFALNAVCHHLYYIIILNTNKCKYIIILFPYTKAQNKVTSSQFLSNNHLFINTVLLISSLRTVIETNREIGTIAKY